MKFLRILAVLSVVCGLALALGEKTSDPVLLETHWKLIEVAGQKAAATGQGREAHFILRTENEAVDGSGGINRFISKYTLGENNALSFLPAVATMMAGLPAAMEIESKFFQALTQTQSYRIKNGKLYLLAAPDGLTLAVFEAVYL